jgi:hypothetical protein
MSGESANVALENTNKDKHIAFITSPYALV